MYYVKYRTNKTQGDDVLIGRIEKLKLIDLKIEASIKELDNKILDERETFEIMNCLDNLRKEKAYLQKDINKRKRVIKQRKGDRMRKRKLKKLKDKAPMAINKKIKINGDEYLARDYVSSRNTYEKKQANKKVRKYKEDISSGGGYRKTYPLKNNVW